MKNVGAGKRGYPVYEKMTMFDESGKETMSYVNEVVELSKATLDASLFDVPQGFREVSDASQMYAAAATPSMDSNNSLSTSSSTSRGSSIGLPNTSSSSLPTSNVLSGANTEAPAPTMNLTPKKAGTLRIGLAT